MVVYTFFYDKKSMTEKNAPPSRAISMATQIRRYDAEHITQYGRTWATIDATRCRRPGGHHGDQFWRKN
jgi:hypothetical protein